MKKTAIVLALLVAPTLAFAKAPAPHISTNIPTIAVNAKSVQRSHFVGDRARVLMVLPMMVDLESLQVPHVKIIQRIGMPESFALHNGEIVKLEIVPGRGRP